MPIPGVIAGALARQTKNCKIAVLGRALPLLDLSAGGRRGIRDARQYLQRPADCRFLCAGIGAEYHPTGVNPAESHDRFHEAHDLIIAGVDRRDRRFMRASTISFNYVNTWPRPVQQPHPPIWIPSQGTSEMIELGVASVTQICSICRRSARSSSFGVS